MTDQILDSLRNGLVNGELSLMMSAYSATTALESYVNGRREIFTGPARAIKELSALTGGPSTEDHFLLTREPGGYDIDVQHVPVTGGRPTRLLHRLHVVDGQIERHIVHSAPPTERLTLPSTLPASVLADTVTGFAHEGLSGAALFRARLDTGEGVVVKYVRPGQDWLARATRDPGREGLLHLEGVFAHLPAGIASPVIDAVRTDDGWVLVMRDVHPARERVRTGDPRQLGPTLLTALHDMHRAFVGTRPSSALCTPADRLSLFSPVRPLVERHGTDTLPKTLTDTWEHFADHADGNLSTAVLRLVADPTGLLSALDQAAPRTLLHGDYRPANLGFADGVVQALDWGLATHGAAELDFVWFLSNIAWDDDEQRTRLEADWRRLTGQGRTSRVMDLAVIFHAVMGEVAFLMAEAHRQPPGFPRPSDETVDWWLRRLDEALGRVGDLSGHPDRPETLSGTGELPGYPGHADGAHSVTERQSRGGPPSNGL